MSKSSLWNVSRSPVESPFAVRPTTVSVVACSTNAILATPGPAADTETIETTSASAADRDRRDVDPELPLHLFSPSLDASSSCVGRPAATAPEERTNPDRPGRRTPPRAGPIRPQDRTPAYGRSSHMMEVAVRLEPRPWVVILGAKVPRPRPGSEAFARMPGLCGVAYPVTVRAEAARRGGQGRAARALRWTTDGVVDLDAIFGDADGGPLTVDVDVRALRRADGRRARGAPGVGEDRFDPDLAPAACRTVRRGRIGADHARRARARRSARRSNGCTPASPRPVAGVVGTTSSAWATRDVRRPTRGGRSCVNRWRSARSGARRAWERIWSGGRARVRPPNFGRRGV